MQRLKGVQVIKMKENMRERREKKGTRLRSNARTELLAAQQIRFSAYSLPWGQWGEIY